MLHLAGNVIIIRIKNYLAARLHSLEVLTSGKQSEDNKESTSAQDDANALAVVGDHSSSAIVPVSSHTTELQWHLIW